MPETLTKPVSALEARVATLSREDLIRGVLTLAWYANAENCELEEDGYVPVQGSSSICRDNGKRARDLLKELGVKR